MPPPAHQKITLTDAEMAALISTWLRFKDEKRRQLHVRIGLTMLGKPGTFGTGEIYRIIEKMAVELVAKRLGPYADGKKTDTPLLAPADFGRLLEAFLTSLAEAFGPLSPKDEKKARDSFDLGVEEVMRKLVIGDTPYDAMLDRVDWMMNVCYYADIPWDRLTLTERHYDWIIQKLHDERSFRTELAAETDPLLRLIDDERVTGRVEDADPEALRDGFRRAITSFVDDEVRRVFGG